MTPPRDGVVKLPDEEEEIQEDRRHSNGFNDASAKAAQRSATASKMLNVFRQMEEAERKERPTEGLKPLKCFTPPLDGGRRAYDSDSGSECTDSEEEDEDSDEEHNGRRHRDVDEELQQAQAAARAKQLRAKFERWESNEVQREQTQLYDGEDQSQIESTKM